ncbi:MAG: tetratricopeptide repeat protein [Gammaproteobacteria bacterium]|nr:tetratricopeptide repeat protein [Gammaproteobacteria bacterium]MBU1414337.1 tetratricopeptide repeat protein [Gammaproteobacteria bacterium]
MPPTASTVPSPNCASPPSRRAAVLLTLALLAGIAAYANSFAGAFQFDDFNVIVNANRVHSLSAWWAATTQGGLRPLLNLTYALNWLTGGGTPPVFHAFNLLVHLVTTACVFALARDFVRRHPQAGDADIIAGWTALLFAVHPLHTEAVTYICGRSTSMMTAFYLGALVCYARAGEGMLRHRLAAPLLFMLAVLTKESSLLLPLALVLWDWSNREAWRVALRRQWPFWALALAALPALALHPGTWALLQGSLHTRDLAASLPTQLHSSTILLGKLFWPAGLNIDPDWPTLAGVADALPQLALFAGAAVLAIWLRPRRPWWTLGILWLLLHLLLPNVFFPRADIANERQMVWAGWPLLLCLVIELRLRARPAVAWTTVLICALALAWATHLRNADYESEIALWLDTARHSPHKARVFNNLGYAYQQAGRDDDARQAYLKALALDPDHVKALNNLERLDAASRQD